MMLTAWRIVQAHQTAAKLTARGLSQNLAFRKNYSTTYAHAEKLAPLVREIGWSYNLIIMEQCEGD